MEESKKWSSTPLFIMACVGSAVGLGNIWKFPYITYENDGGTFVIIYLAAILIVGLPVLLAEMMIGRSTESNAYDSIVKLAKDKKYWYPLGALCIFTAFTILTFYSVVAGWTLHYFFESLMGNLKELDFQTTNNYFGNFVGNSTLQITFHTIIIALTSFFIIKGTKSIERAIEVLMPIFGVLIMVVAGASIYKFGATETLDFLFHFNPEKVTSHSVLEAFGHAFFTLSIGLGAMIVYGSYFPKKESILKAAFWIGLLDTVIAIVACLMIFPIIFGSGMDVSESSSILFTTLSVQLHSLPGGQYLSAVFYLLIAFAALSSTISLLEPCVAFVIEHFKWKRLKAIAFTSISIWFIGIFCALSNGANKAMTDLNVMGKLDYFTSNWTLPLGGLFISIFTGWVVSKELKVEEFGRPAEHFTYKVWNFLIKFVSPVLIVLIIISKFLGL